MLNTRESAQFLGVNKGNFSTYIVPVISHLRIARFHKNEWFYEEKDLIKLKPFLKEHGCGNMAARAIKQFLDGEKK